MSSATNKLVSTLSEINADSLPSFSSATSNSVSDTSSSGFFSNFTWQTWLIIILILAFLGINIFSYLEMGTEKTVDIFAPILKLVGYQTLETTKQTINTSATGSKAGVDIVANTTTDTINAIEDTAKTRNNTNSNNNSSNNNSSNNNSSNNNSSNNNSNTNFNSVTGQRATSSPSLKNAQSIQDQQQMEKQINELEDWQQQNLQKALSDASNANVVKPDDSLSRIQSSNSSGKAGWCFIGEDRGFRTCSQIGQNDQCLSGDIFPSQEICMNPNLRP